MVGYGDRLSGRTKRGALVVAVAVGVVTALLFHSSLLAYVSLYEVSTADVSADSARLADDGDAIVVQLRVSNPSSREVTVTGAQVFARVNGTLVNDVGGVEVNRTTLAPGRTSTVTLRLPLLADRSTAVSAWTSGNASLVLSGDLGVSVRGRTMTVRFEEGVP